MFNIDKVEMVHPRHEQWCHFPTIDFKFQNTGSAVASLWRFTINIVHAEIDPTPTFDFEASVDKGVLQVEAVNNGWGPAYGCHLQFEETSSTVYAGNKSETSPQIINHLFTASMRQYDGNFQSGESKKVMCLSHDSLNPDQLVSFLQQLKDTESCFLRGADKIKIQSLRGLWKCKDSQGKEHQSQNHVRVSGPASMSNSIYLTPQEFSHESHVVLHSLMFSDTVYAAIIDISKGAHEQTYPISRRIPSGDVERFHVMIGSPMSCHLTIQFKFFIDQTQIVQSELFDIEIWNPRDSMWRGPGVDYKDGAELVRKIGQANSDNSAYERKYLQREAENYPFIEEGKGRSFW